MIKPCGSTNHRDKESLFLQLNRIHLPTYGSKYENKISPKKHSPHGYRQLAAMKSSINDVTLKGGACL